MKRISYKKLLEKYMLHVFSCESITFVDDGVLALSGSNITEDEHKILKQIELKIRFEENEKRRFLRRT